VQGSKQLSDLFGAFDETVDKMTPVNASTAFRRIAKICLVHPKQSKTVHNSLSFKRLQKRVRQSLLSTLPSLKERPAGDKQCAQVPLSVSRVCWSYAQLRLQDPSLFAVVAQQCVPNLAAFGGPALCHLLWAYAMNSEETWKCRNRLFKFAGDEVLGRPKDFKRVNWSTLAWSFARTQCNHEGLFRFIAAQMVNQGDHVESHAIAKTLWAFAVFGVACTPQSPNWKLGDIAARRLDSFKPQEMAYIAWAFGKMEMPHPDFFENLNLDLKTRAAGPDGLSKFEPKYIIMVISAVAGFFTMGDGGEVWQHIEVEPMAEVDNVEDSEWKEDLVEGEEQALQEEETALDQDNEQLARRLLECSKGGGGSGLGQIWALGLAKSEAVARVQAVALGLAKSLLPESLRQAESFRREEAERLSSACDRLGLRRPQDNVQRLLKPPGFMELLDMVERFSDICNAGG